MKFVLCLFLIALVIPPIESSGTLKVEIDIFSRTSGTDASGGCCDFLSCYCDPFFTFCWRNYLTSITDTSCSSPMVTGRYNDQNVVYFNSATFNGGIVTNPLTLGVTNSFNGRMQLYVQVEDGDSISANDLMDRFAIDFTVTSSSSLSSYVTFTGIYGSTITVSKTLTCSANYYNSLCNMYCVAQNSDALGHYTCNPNDGSFVCNSGYSGNDCKTPICTTGCLNGGCVTPFTCNCFSGWQGSTCSTCIPSGTCDPNGGFCDAAFNCKCHPDYEGTNCDQDTEFCEHNPGICNNGVCTTTGINQYSCTCTAGYTGTNCETAIDLCTPDPCDNGMCVNYMTDYDCNCDVGYEGKNCTKVIDNCPTSNCSFGVCVNQVGSFTCDCSAGYTGVYCETDQPVIPSREPPPLPPNHPSTRKSGSNRPPPPKPPQTGGPAPPTKLQKHPAPPPEIDECGINPCITGDCLDFVNGYVCNCTDASFVGLNCSLASSSNPNPDYCSADFNSCLNGATCTDNSGADPLFTCVCSAGYFGTYCGDNLDNCPSSPSSNPCNNSATCVDLAGDEFRCQCNPGYQGTLCELDINECDLSPCNNDGTCTNFLGGFSCSCTVGFEGDTCIDRTDYCAMGNACANEATCINNRFNYTCQCVLGFRGEFCVENINDCVNVSCGNGTCVDKVNDFTCDCTPGYIGLECEIELDECMTELSTVIADFPGSTSVCGVYGECSDELNSFTCTCGDRYNGDLCRDVINCDSNPCNTSNIVACLDTDTFDCICQPGFTGPLCSINIDECAQFPCHNSAPCTDGRDDYSCACISPWKGKDCRYQNTSCLPNPCNSGVCLDVNLDLGTLNCTCPQGYTGSRCESDLNECVSGDNSCPTNVSCTNTGGSYYCNCPNAGSGIDIFTCAEIGAFQGLSTQDYLYYVVIPVISFLVIAALVFCFFLFCCCCCIAKRNKEADQAEHPADLYQSLDVNNYEEIAYRLPDEAVTNNPAYITGIEMEKQTNLTAVTSNPHYGGIQTEENLYLPEPNQSYSASVQPLKSVYNDISEFPTADDIDAPIKGIYNENVATSSLTFSPGVEENEYGDN